MNDNEVFLPWGKVTANFWTTPAPSPTPSTTPPAPPSEPARPPAPEPPSDVDVPARIAAIVALAEAGRLDEAVLLAEQLDTEYAATPNGSTATATTDIREVRGYLASLTGDHQAAVTWYLHAVRLRASLHGPDHPDTGAAVQRTYSLWQTITDPALSHRLGTELLTTVLSIQGPHSPAARQIQSALGRPVLRSPA
ncbi:tetratricopeptide repeat protein [Streptomyces sp. NPDC047718]|uniref:tetratricopeptide repeat protein n=1 Tax=Streptomyces sp. NPDC047718 TaxID=3155479 RepID=UPI0033FB6CBB